MIETLLFPLQFSFIIKGIIITTIIAIPMALLSCFLILKGWSLLGDAISHAIFPGVVLGYVVTPYMISLLLFLPIASLQTMDILQLQNNFSMAFMAIGAFIAGMVCAILTGFLSNNSRIKQDTIMGVIFSSMFGLGLIISVKIESEIHLNHILFGNLLGIAWLDIWQTLIIALLVVILLLFKWREFLLFCFDPIQARAVGLFLPFLHYSLLTMISLTIVAALKAVGTILAIALLIAPGAIAYLMTKRFSLMLIFAVLIACMCSFFGVYVSSFIGSDPASTIVLCMTFLFTLAFLFADYKQRQKA